MIAGYLSSRHLLVKSSTIRLKSVTVCRPYSSSSAIFLIRSADISYMYDNTHFKHAIQLSKVYHLRRGTRNNHLGQSLVLVGPFLVQCPNTMFNRLRSISGECRVILQNQSWSALEVVCLEKARSRKKNSLGDSNNQSLKVFRIQDNVLLLDKGDNVP